MDGEFAIGNKHYIIKEDNENVRIFIADKNGNPSIELALINYNDVNNKSYLSYDMNKAFISLINNFNKHYPVKFISYSEKIIITQNHSIYFLKKNKNMLSIYKAELKEIEKNNNDSVLYQQMLNKVLHGEKINIGYYILSANTFFKFLTGEISIESIADNNSKEIIQKLIVLYKKMFGETITQQTESGSGNENAKVKTKRHAGFANKLFMISLSCFSVGVIVALIIVVLNRYFF